MSILTELKKIRHRENIPDPNRFSILVEEMVEMLQTEAEPYRPLDSFGLPGGLVHLQSSLPTIIVPDLHGRRGLLLALLQQEIDGETVADLLESSRVQVVCVGDGMHTETDTDVRWAEAGLEYQKDFEDHAAMDSEMADGLGLMEIVFRLKLAFPRHFHFLKGNHENILNEEADGNMSFMKMAMEGNMVRTYFSKFYGDSLLAKYAVMEKSLPLLAKGDTFLISHAEPRRAFTEEEIIEYRSHSDVIFGLTWTRDDQSAPGSVESMLATLLPGNGRWYFGGHRAIRERYRLRCNDHFVQIHNRHRYQVAYLFADGSFRPSQDIILLDEQP